MGTVAIPMRPINGGRLADAVEYGMVGTAPNWFPTAKINGRRIGIQLSTGKVYSRHDALFSDASKVPVDAIIELARASGLSSETDQIDCEFVFHRHAHAKGTVVALDYVPNDRSLDYVARRGVLTNVLPVHPLVPADWKEVAYLVLQGEDPQQLHDALYAQVKPQVDAGEKFENWFYEGIVNKKADSTYTPNRSVTACTPAWVKYRFVVC